MVCNPVELAAAGVDEYLLQVRIRRCPEGECARDLYTIFGVSVRKCSSIGSGVGAKCETSAKEFPGGDEFVGAGKFYLYRVSGEVYR